MRRSNMLLDMEDAASSGPVISADGRQATPKMIADFREHLESYEVDWAQPRHNATIQGLVGRTELNDKPVVLVKLDASAGRWQVRELKENRTLSGEIIRVKPANLHPWPPCDASGV